MKQKQVSRIIIPLCVFIVCFLPRILLLVNIYPVAQQRDEVCALGGAALFAGYDWSQVISTGHVYYGCGYTALFAPVLRLVKDPVLFYRCVIYCSTAIFGLCGIVAYMILSKEFAVRNKAYLFFASVLCSYMTCETGMVSINEPMLILCIWLSSWLLCRLCRQRDGRGKIVDTVLYVLVISYALTLHTRAQLLWILSIIILILYRVVYKSSLFSTPVLFVTGVVGYYSANVFINYVQRTIWLSETVGKAGEAVSGTEVSSGLKQLQLLLQIEYWKTFLTVIAGQINTGIIFTGGFLVIAFSLAIGLLKDDFFFRNRHVKIKYDENRNQHRKIQSHKKCKSESAVTDRKMVTILIWATLGIVASMVYIAVTWLRGTYSAMQEGFGGNAYSLRSITYLRYYFCYVGPFCIPGIVLLERKELDRKLTISIMWIIGSLHVIWLTLILPYVYHSDNAKDIFDALAFKRWDSNADIQTYLSGTVFLIGVFIVFMLMWKKKQIIVALSVLCIFLGYENLFLIHNYNDKSHALFGTADWGQRLRIELEWQGTGEGVVFYTLERDMAYMYQILNPSWSIVYGMPDKNSEEAVIIDCRYNPLLASQYLWAKLDDNEYIYVRGKHSQEVIKATLSQAEKKLNSPFKPCTWHLHK